MGKKEHRRTPPPVADVTEAQMEELFLGLYLAGISHGANTGAVMALGVEGSAPDAIGRAVLALVQQHVGSDPLARQEIIGASWHLMEHIVEGTDCDDE